MTLILDAGAFLAVERQHRATLALLKDNRGLGLVPRTHGGIVGQVWRGGRDHQVPVARALAATDVVPLDDVLGRRAGELLTLTGGSDVVDAALVLLAYDGDTVLTSDPEDLVELARAADLHLDITRV